MSMTVHIAMRGITDLEILLEALREMGINAQATKIGTPKQTSEIVAFADMCSGRVGFVRDASGVISMVGDNEWRAMNDQRLQQRIRQHYKILIEDIKKLGQTVHESPTGEFYEKEQNQSRILGQPLLLTNLTDCHKLQILSAGGIDRSSTFPLVRRGVEAVNNSGR